MTLSLTQPAFRSAPSATRWFRLAGLSLLLALLAACTTTVRLPGAGGEEPAVPLAQAVEGYGRVLQQHVNERGEVDFAALRDDRSATGLPALRQYLRAVADTPLAADWGGWQSPQARMAHLINAYNALSMYNVIASNIPPTHAGLAKLRFFVLREFEVGGQTLSLYAFENDIIRPLDEPRAHFALNCSAVACPVLPRVPFTAAALEVELERETRAFFARDVNLSIDHTKKTVVLSELLNFYPEDFVPGHAPSLLAYAQRYAPQPIPSGYSVVFRPYDWTVANSQRAR
jgi:hypothetical protein